MGGERRRRKAERAERAQRQRHDGVRVEAHRTLQQREQRLEKRAVGGAPRVEPPLRSAPRRRLSANPAISWASGVAPEPLVAPAA